MIGLIRKYTRWLHTRWPAGVVEKLPQVNDDGSTNVPGLYIVGDLTGIPLLKFSADGGARAARTILNDPAFQRARGDAGADDFESGPLGTEDHIAHLRELRWGRAEEYPARQIAAIPELASECVYCQDCFKGCNGGWILKQSGAPWTSTAV